VHSEVWEKLQLCKVPQIWHEQIKESEQNFRPKRQRITKTQKTSANNEHASEAIDYGKNRPIGVSFSTTKGEKHHKNVTCPMNENERLAAGDGNQQQKKKKNAESTVVEYNNKHKWIRNNES